MGRGRAGSGSPDLDRFEPKPLDALEVAAVVRGESKVAAEGGSADQEIEVRDEIASLAQTPPLTPEHLAGFRVERYEGDADALSETAGTFRRRPPALGEHTDEILGELGYSADAIGALRAAKVI
jgi:hypothetical protein